MNHGDIKLVIDQLNAVDSDNLFDRLSIKAATVTLETLGNQVAAQAAVIEKLQGYLYQISLMSGHVVINNTCAEALATPTDSTKVLQEWLDKKLGEPVGYQELFDAIAAGTKPYAGSGISISVKAFTGCIGPLFKKPEKL